MCYQVVERYSVCGCLYYKHAVNPCAAHGQRGHRIQEKTVLVGYACSQHSKGASSQQYAGQYDDQDIVDTDSEVSEDSDGAGSTWSSAITVSRATSFIATGDQDSIEEVLKVLVNDPLLRWEGLVNDATGYSDMTSSKDVRFFLRAFESHLRELADSNMERHACFWFRSRIGYLADRIREHFNLQRDTTSYLATEGDECSPDMLDKLQPIDIEEPDHTVMPTLASIRDFMFGGVPYQSLKESLKLFTREKRDYLEEMTEIIIKNIHPPDIGLVTTDRREELKVMLWTYLNWFLTSLHVEATEANIPASDRIGIKTLLIGGSRDLENKISAIWTRGLPPWHFYPAVIGHRSCTQPTIDEVESLERSLGFDSFEAFVCTSSTFLTLSQNISRLLKRSSLSERVRRASSGTSSWTIDMSSARVGEATMTFRCVGLSCSHLFVH